MPSPALKLADDTTRKPPRRFAFTRAEIEKLAPPAKGRLYVYDDRQPGLALAVTATGHRAFYIYRWASGKPVKLKLGNYDDITIPQARDRVKELTGEIAKGEDPAAQRRKQRDGRAHMPTLEGAWERYRDDYLKEQCSPHTLKGDGYLFDAVPLKTRRLDSIATEDVKNLYERLGRERGPVKATRCVQFLRRLYNYAADELGYSGENPVVLRKNSQKRRRGKGKAVVLARERSRERYIEPREMPGFLAALDDEPDADLADLIRMLLYTGARMGNVLAMAWADVGLSRGTWTIPAEAAKAGEAIVVPLSSHALAALKRRRDAAAEDAVWVFPSRQAGVGHIAPPHKKWGVLRDRAGIPGVTFHDLRRTVGSWASINGVAYPVVKAMLGHAQGEDVTAIYARVDIETVRKAFETTTAAMLAEATAEKE